MSKSVQRISLYVAIVALLTFGASAFAAIEVAKIGNKTMTDADVKALVGNLPQAQRQQLDQDDDTKARVVENMVVEQLFVQEAEKSGITKDKDFTQALERTRRQLLAQRFLQKNVQPKITDDNMKKFFDKNKNRYSQDEVHAFHVLLKTEAEAKEVYGKAKGGEDFEVLAKKYSKDPSAAQNMGDLGFFTRTRMVPAFADAAFAMEKGQISQPVKSPFGWHVIKVVDKRAGKAVSFADVKEQVKSDFQQESINELISSLKKSNKVTIFEDKVKQLHF